MSETKDKMEKIKQILEEANQEHLLTFYNQLNDEEKKILENDILNVEWEKIEKIKSDFIDKSTNKFILKSSVVFEDTLLSPLPQDIVGSSLSSTQEQLDKYRAIGLENIKNGHVTALVLAGGQGTRLGFDYPKGMLDVGLPSHKTLFQLQAERILKLANETGGKMYWYILTNPTSHVQTVEFMHKNNYFGLSKKKVILFQQNTLPSFDLEGKIFLQDKYQLSKSPAGNGDLFDSLHKSGVIKSIQKHNIKFVHVYCVDNILVRVCDPVFMGFCIDKKAQAGSKAVEKVSPNEAVGTICKVGDEFKVIEYSEISEAIAQKRDDKTGKLLFSAGNICEQFFDVVFLDSILTEPLPYHVAIKKIPHISPQTGNFMKPSEPNGVKFEKFIFDFLKFTNKFVVWEVSRNDEFSPIKNSDGSATDTPTTAREALLRLYSLGKLDC